MNQWIPQQQCKQKHTDDAHCHHEYGIEKQLCQNKMRSSCNGIEVQHSATTFLKKTLSHSIYANEQLNDPKQSIPNLVIGASHCQVQYKYGRCYIQENPI